MTVQIGALKFLDSCQFLPCGLDTLVDVLKQSGVDKFVYTNRYLNSTDANVFAKGVFPYTLFDSVVHFDETALPPKEAFYNDLADEPISDEDYECAQYMWNLFQCKTLKDYQNLYLKMDVLILSDVFQNFRQSILSQQKLDPLHFISLPGLAWCAALKLTRAEVDLISDPDMYLMIEKSMHGVISVVSERLANADMQPEGESTFLSYVDMNNLYEWSLKNNHPHSNFRWLNDEEVSQFDITKIPEDTGVGYILEVDLLYPDHLHGAHNFYPLAPDHLKIHKNMLSPYQLEFLDHQMLASIRKISPQLNEQN